MIKSHDPVKLINAQQWSKSIRLTEDTFKKNILNFVSRTENNLAAAAFRSSLWFCISGICCHLLPNHLVLIFSILWKNKKSQHLSPRCSPSITDLSIFRFVEKASWKWNLNNLVKDELNKIGKDNNELLPPTHKCSSNKK